MRTRRQARFTTRHNNVRTNLHKKIFTYNCKNEKQINSRFCLTQKGGGVAEDNGIDVWENEDGSAIAIYVGKKRKASYILLIFDTDLKIMELESFSTDRIVPNHIQTSESVSDLFVRIIYDICKQKGAKQLVLQDNSEILCGKQKVRLMDMYFLAYGKTWYESKFIGLQCDKDIDMYRQKVVNNTWTNVSNALKADFPQHYERFLAYIQKFDIDPNEQGSAMKLCRILKENRACEPFARFMDPLLISSKIPSLFSTTWHLDF